MMSYATSAGKLLLFATTCIAANILFFLHPPTCHAEDKAITVLGTAIPRSELTSSSEEDLRYTLNELVIDPLFKHYYESHKSEIEPNANEITDFLLFKKREHERDIADKKKSILERIQQIMVTLQDEKTQEQKQEDLLAELYYLKSELEPPGYDYAMFVVPYWKTQKYLYDTFGGGRILYTERGYEAFDAMHTWLKEQEKEGNIVIHDSKIRKALYYHWEDEDHGDFLISDKKEIQKVFLHPEWLN